MVRSKKIRCDANRHKNGKNDDDDNVFLKTRAQRLFNSASASEKDLVVSIDIVTNRTIVGEAYKVR